MFLAESFFPLVNRDNALPNPLFLFYNRQKFMSLSARRRLGNNTQNFQRVSAIM
jgi:hypothetical protein